MDNPNQEDVLETLFTLNLGHRHVSLSEAHLHHSNVNIRRVSGGSVTTLHEFGDSLNVEQEEVEGRDEEVIVVQVGNHDDETSNTEENDVFEEVEDEVTISQRYLTINSTPMYRWSEGMLPTIITTPSSVPRLKRQVSVYEDSQDAEVSSHISATTWETDEDDNSSIGAKDLCPGIVDTTASAPNVASDEANYNPVRSLRSPWIVERLKHLAKAYSERGSFVKQAIDDLTDEEDDAEGLEDSDHEDTDRARSRDDQLKHLFGDEWSVQSASPALDSGQGALAKLMSRVSARVLSSYEPQSGINIAWLFVVSLAFVYNVVCIPYRLIFPHLDLVSNFILLDIATDLIYAADCLWFKTRLRFIRNGEWIVETRETRRNYFCQPRFRWDLMALVPLDWTLAVYLGWPGGLKVLARGNRLLRWEAFHEFFRRVDSITAYPYVPRIIHMLLYMLYIIHLGACVFYYASWYQGFGSTPWSYSGKGGAYLRCFYFSFRTTTSIGGRMPKPSNDFERVYMTAAWLLGVFIFAMVIGQIRDIVSTASRNSDYYRYILNMMADYLRGLAVPGRLQKRVRFWLSFTWEQQATFNEADILRVLPAKMQADIALSVHSHTLARVELFRNIDRSVLRELVLRMRPILYLPGDYICRKGDVGHEMYIVNKGTLHVIAPDGKLLVTLADGSVFGEIAILGLEGYNRRTADVRAAGYVQLFVLSKSDLWETLKNYPEYEAVLKKKVKKILKNKLKGEAQNKTGDQEEQKTKHEDEDEDGSVIPVVVEPIVNSRPRTPKLFTAVMQLVPQDSKLKAEFVHQNVSRANSLEEQSSDCKEIEQDN